MNAHPTVGGCVAVRSWRAGLNAGLLPPWKPFAFFQCVQVHVVAHVTLGCGAQGLVVPWVVGAVAQGLVDHPAAGLGLAHVLVVLGQVPAGGGQGFEMREDFGGAGVGREV